jgi:pentapeptide MXKDX repeat protein
MRKLWLGVAGAIVCLGLGLAVVGCGSSSPDKGKMGTDKMGGDKMGGDKMGGDKMGGDKMGGDAKDKM